MHMITKIADLEVLLEEVDPVTFAEDERLPYWAELWPSSVALAHYAAQCLDVSGRQVLETGMRPGARRCRRRPPGSTRVVYRL